MGEAGRERLFLLYFLRLEETVLRRTNLLPCPLTKGDCGDMLVERRTQLLGTGIR